MSTGNEISKGVSATDYEQQVKRLKRNLFDCQEAAKDLAQQATKAEAERDALAAKLKELEGQAPFDASNEKFRVAFEVALDASNWPKDRKGHGYRSPMTQMAWGVAFSTVNLLSLFARPIPAEPVNARLLEALKRLSFCAQTTGGVAGRDDELCSAIEASAKAIAEAEAQQERLLQDMHDAGREIDRVMAEAAPKAVRLTAPDIVDALRGNGLYEDSRAFQRLFPILEADARAIESAVLRKNGIEVAE